MTDDRREALRPFLRDDVEPASLTDEQVELMTEYLDKVRKRLDESSPGKPPFIRDVIYSFSLAELIPKIPAQLDGMFADGRWESHPVTFKDDDD